MANIEMIRDAYPEQLMAAMRDEIRRREREQEARDAAARRRRERRAALHARLRSLVGRREVTPKTRTMVLRRR